MHVSLISNWDVKIEQTLRNGVGYQVDSSDHGQVPHGRCLDILVVRSVHTLGNGGHY